MYHHCRMDICMSTPCPLTGKLIEVMVVRSRMPMASSGLCLVCLPLRTSLATEKESPSPLLVPCLESNEAKTAETREQDVTTVLQCLGGKSDGYMTWAGLVNFSLATSESMRCAATTSDGFCLLSICRRTIPFYCF